MITLAALTSVRFWVHSIFNDSIAEWAIYLSAMATGILVTLLVQPLINHKRNIDKDLHETKRRWRSGLHEAVLCSLRIYDNSGEIKALPIFTKIDEFFNSLDVDCLPPALKAKLKKVQQEQEEWIRLQDDVINIFKKLTVQHFGKLRQCFPNTSIEKSPYAEVMTTIFREDFDLRPEFYSYMTKTFCGVLPDKCETARILQEIKAEISSHEMKRRDKSYEVINAIRELKEELKKKR